MARPRSIVALTVALGLVAAACSAGTGGDPTTGPSTTEDRSQGGPSTTAPFGGGTSPIRPGVRIEVLSSQPDRVTGDDARVRVSPPAGEGVAQLRLTLDGQDVTAQLAPVDGALEGVVEGFIEGTNTLEATLGDGQGAGTSVIQRVRAWPLTGPVISGPHLPLLACATDAHGLGPATDRNCSAATTVTWGYVDPDDSIVWLDSRDPAGLADVPAATAEIDGETVPLYVRRERGVINRSTYDIAAIDPSAGTAAPGAAGWNGGLLYRFAGGPACTGLYGQGTPGVAAADPAYLRLGYVVATASFNDAGVSCSDVLSAETTMMVRERVIETYGLPELTIGEATSGGSALAHLMTQNYPGLINAVVASSPFPDAITVAAGATDCALLEVYRSTAPGQGLTDDQAAAVAGHATAQTCAQWVQSFGGATDPTQGCDPLIDADAVFDPTANRGGVRCTLADANRNQSLADDSTGHALSPVDNVGVQYGLEALNAGVISMDQFLDLNDGIGGTDRDGRPASERTAADPEAVLHAYETGRVAMGGGDQGNVPMIVIDPYTDPTGDVHDHLRPFSIRDRLAFTGPGDAPGQAIWTEQGETANLAQALEISGRASERAVDAVTLVGDWLRALQGDTEGGPLPDVLRRTRPGAAADTCWPPGERSPVRGDDVYGPDGSCTAAFPMAGSPRIAAGGPISDHVLKCGLKAVDPLDYDVAISRAQFDRLTSIFSQGVCDWAGPSVGETVPASPDRSYQDVETPAVNA